MQRREFILAGLAAMLTASGCATMHRQQPGASVLFGCGKSSSGSRSDFCAQAIDRDGALVWQQALEGRGHSGCCIGDGVVFIARRPGTWLQLLDKQTGKLLQHINAPPNRHFMGHASYCMRSKRLFVSEADWQTSAGVIGVYQMHDGELRRQGEWQGYGIGLHEIKLMADSTLAVAVGGVHTQGRKMLNIASMQPALLRVNSTTGAVIDRQILSNHRLSIRHLDVRGNAIVIAQQLRGTPQQVAPLIALQRQVGEPLQHLAASAQVWRQFEHYVASVAMSDRYILATSPRGNCFACWHLETGSLIRQGHLLDASGATWLGSQPWLASGAGVMLTGEKLDRHLAGPIWDNHWFS